MDLRSLVQILTLQIQAMREAPIPPVIAVLLTAAIVWLVLKWRYTAKIDQLRRAVARRDAELANYRAHAGTIAVVDDDVDSEGEASPQATTPAAGRSRPLRLILNAIEEAEMALRSRDPGAAEQAMASMGLALRTANTAFALPVPTFGADPVADITRGKSFLERVRPPLRAGDDEEARRVAAVFLGQEPSATTVAAAV